MPNFFKLAKEKVQIKWNGFLAELACCPDSWETLEYQERKKVCKMLAEKICREEFGITGPKVIFGDKKALEGASGCFFENSYSIVIQKEMLEKGDKYSGLEVMDTIWHELVHARQYELCQKQCYQSLLDIGITEQQMMANTSSCTVRHKGKSYDAIMSIQTRVGKIPKTQSLYYCQPMEYEAWVYSTLRMEQFIKKHHLTIPKEIYNQKIYPNAVHHAAKRLTGSNDLETEHELVRQTGNAMVNLVTHDYLECNPYLQERVKEAAMIEADPSLYERESLLNGRIIENNMQIPQFDGDDPGYHNYGYLKIINRNDRLFYVPDMRNDPDIMQTLTLQPDITQQNIKTSNTISSPYMQTTSFYQNVRAAEQTMKKMQEDRMKNAGTRNQDTRQEH